MRVELDIPVMGHEQPEDLILNARRKIFVINTNDDILSGAVAFPTQRLGGDRGNAEKLPPAMSLTSVGDADFLNSTDNSPTSESSQEQQSSRKRVVSFAKMEAEETAGKRSEDTSLSHHPRHTQLPVLSPSIPSSRQDQSKSPLLRARLVSKSTSRHILVISFPRIICDFWSSCLFIQQLADIYSKLEKAASYRPSLAAKKIESKRQEVMGAFEKERKKNAPVRKLDAATRLLQKRAMTKKVETVDCHLVPMVVSRLKFPQIAQREKQLVMMMSRDDLQGFWEGVITATIKRERGLNRTKVVPPVRIPSGLGEMAPVTSYSRRPQTSRLRPLTASRARPATAKRQGGGGGGVFGDMGFTREALLGPATKFHFIKVCHYSRTHQPNHDSTTLIHMHVHACTYAYTLTCTCTCTCVHMHAICRLKMKYVSSSNSSFPRVAASHQTNVSVSSPLGCTY